MKVIFSGICALLFVLPAFGQETWERCIDERDFDFHANSFTRSSRMSKSGCNFRLVVLGGKGKKYQVNICEPRVHIEEYSSIDSSTPQKFYAGSAGCPAPLFGADFDLPPGQKGAKEFQEAKEKVLEIAESVRKLIAPSISAKDVERLKDTPGYNSEAQLACGIYLLQEYLERCVAFEAKPKEETEKKAVNIPGVHPETITLPKKK